MNPTIQQLYTFMIPHMTQQNINEGMLIIFKIMDELNRLTTSVKLMEASQKYIMDENIYLRKEIKQILESLNMKLENSLTKLDHSSMINALQLRKYDFHESKEVSTKTS